ncbi:MAG TPA: methyltransferase domain-containing protein [Pyrinomonadaceae bacterium]
MVSSSAKSAFDERLRLEFNDWARAGRGESMEKGHRPVGEQALALMGVGRGAHVLDVGCGSGWASRLLAKQAVDGSVVGIDISDEMVELARASSSSLANLEFQVASAQRLPFDDRQFTHAFSMESLYYYADIPGALAEIYRVLMAGGMFVTVVDLFEENKASHQWVDQLNVPVQLLSTTNYRSLLAAAGFVNIRDSRLYDPAPIPAEYTGTSFSSYEDFVSYRRAGSLLLIAEAEK